MSKIDDVLIDPFEKLYAEDVPKLSVPEIEEKKEPKKKKQKVEESVENSSEILKEADKEEFDVVTQNTPKISLAGMEKQLVEAALFTSPKPLKVDEISRIISVSSLGLVKKVLDELKQDYSQRGIEIIEHADGYRMQVKKELGPKVADLTPHQDLSTGLKKALALIVYKEPLKQSELIDMQGSKAYDYVKELEERGLIKREPFKRTKILKLTKEFENYFGLEKEKIKEMVRKEMAKHELKKESKLA